MTSSKMNKECFSATQLEKPRHKNTKKSIVKISLIKDVLTGQVSLVISEGLVPPFFTNLKSPTLKKVQLLIYDCIFSKE